MPFFPVPALALVEHGNIASIDGSGCAIRHLLPELVFQWGEDFLLLLLSLRQFLLYFGVQTEGDTLLAVEVCHRYLVGKICLDYPVQDFQPLLDRLFLDGVGGQDGRFFFRQVIDQIGGDLFGLYGQCPCLLIDDKAVGGKTFLPFLIGKIDRRAYQFLVGTGRFRAARTTDQRRDDRLQVLQYVGLLCRLHRLSGLVFVIEAVAARLQFARLHASVPPFRDNGRPRIEQLAADPPQMEAPLVAWRPAEERGRHTQPSHTPVFADTDTVAVQPHSDTAIGIAGMDEVLGHIKVFPYNAREHVVGFLVGRVCSPVRQGQHLTLGKVVGQQRRIVALHHEPVARAVADHVGLHTVTPQYVLHFGLQVHHSGVGILSYRHNPLLKRVSVMHLRSPSPPPVARPCSGRTRRRIRCPP